MLKKSGFTNHCHFRDSGDEGLRQSTSKVKESILKNYLKIALRNLLRHKGYSFVNIAGLAIGMAACILILLFIQHELSFESMHADAGRIYRVLTIDKALGTHNQRVGISMPALGPALPGAFPEVEASLRLSFGGQTLLSRPGDNRPSIYAQQLRSADANFFDFFDYALLHGDPTNALAEPFSLVLTASLAKQIFGLVVFQFALSIALIGATLVIQKQLRFVQHKDLGYDREQVMIFDVVDQAMGRSLENFRQQLTQHSAFISAAQAGNVPGRTFGRTRVRPEGVADEDIWIWTCYALRITLYVLHPSAPKEPQCSAIISKSLCACCGSKRCIPSSTCFAWPWVWQPVC